MYAARSISRLEVFGSPKSLAGSFGPALYSSMSPMTGPFNPQGNVQRGLHGCRPSLQSSGICSGARGVMHGGGKIAKLVGSVNAKRVPCNRC